MNEHYNNPPLGPTAPTSEMLLAGVAIRIELPPSQHRLAVERYEAVRTYIERPDSPLHDRVAWYYPQGSMAIRATIKSHRGEDGFDIDIIAELNLPHSCTPAQILDILYDAIKGEKGSRYYDVVERQTRCVTVYYADGMHLDITPSLLLNENDPRLSHIFHAKPEEHASLHSRVVTNSWAFCERFNQVLVPDLIFEQAYAQRASDFERMSIRADADVKPVPAHSTIEGGKSSAVVALQLLKRNRNMRYAKRKGERMPPSVMLAKFASDSRAPTSSIAGALDKISATILTSLEVAEAKGELIDVRNPTCNEDCFTDRWPETRNAQLKYIVDLKQFRKQLHILMNGGLALDEMRDLLVEMFGEGPAQSTIEEEAARRGYAIKTGQRAIAPTGRVIPTIGIAAPAIISPAFAQPPKHTFYGTRWKKQ
jgi:Second Messenger Oligonucleotide or Dinucleotide Synthetase domain